MKRILFLLFFGLCMVHLVKAQVKIGDNPQSLDAASILELQSTDKVLVITRVSTTQMDAITPLRGALVYNTDVQSVHYFDGNQWVNIGGGGDTSGALTADPIVNDISTIVITPTGTGSNLEVAENSIGTTQIRNFSINGTEDILDGSIGTGKFGEDVITQFELSENSVGPIELDNANIGLSAFANDVGYITSASIVSIDTDNALQIGTDNGAFYDETPLLNAIQDNADDIAADNDQSPSNEIQNLTLTGSVIGLTDTGGTIDIGPLVNGGGSDDQNIGPVTFDAGTNELSIGIEGGNAGTVNLGALAGGGGSTEVADQTTITGVGTAGDPFKIEPGGNGQFLTTNAGGAVAWATVTPGGGGTTEVVDGTLLTGVGTAGDPFTIAPAAALDPIADQVLITTAAGALEWQPFSTGGGEANVATNAGTGGVGITLAKNVVSLPFKSINSGSTPAIITVTDDAANNEIDLDIANSSLTIDKLAPNGATIDGQIIQWNTDLDGPGPGTDAGWEVAENAGHLGTNQNNVFFAGPGGVPYDTESNDDGSFASQRDNGGFFWDSTKRFDTGALYLGLKRNGNADGTSVIESNPEGHSKLILAEKYANATGEFSLAFPLQLRNESDTPATGTGVLFAVNTAGNPGKGAIVFQRGATESEGDFHFLVSQTNVDTRPAFNESVLTVENDGDIRLFKGIDIDGVGFGDAGEVLASGGAGNALQWIDPSGLPTGTDEWDIVTWKPDIADPTNNTYISSKPQSIKLDVANNKIDLLRGDGTAINSSIQLDNITLEAANNGADVIRIKPGAISAATPKDRILVTDKDTGNVGWEDKPLEGHNGAAAGSIFFSANTPPFAPTDNPTQLFWDNNLFKLYVGPQNTTTADVKLNVGGVTRTQGIKNSMGSATQPAYRFTEDLNSGMYLPSGGGQLGFSTGGVEALRLDENQNVGIGTDDPLRKLHVAGELQVDTGIWVGGTQLTVPDYVFEKYFSGNSRLKTDYEFKSLEEIEEFVKRNQHLPGITSAKKTQEEGQWNLSQSNIQNLEKIEELFLHTIEQEHKIKTLQSENQNLSEELQSLKRDLEEIKALLKNN